MRSITTRLALPFVACAAVVTVAACGSREEDVAEHLPDNPTRGDASTDPDTDGGANGTAAPSDVCRGGINPGASSLLFDGTSAYVTMGNAKALGLTAFTVEAWIRRDGAGREFSTGVGGLHLVPIAGKGRGEADGSNVDCNYTLGLVGDVLGADFEDFATGANHPVLGATPVAYGAWHHVAASYDGTSWLLYLDGVLDGKTDANAQPRYDSIQHFGIGSALNSKGETDGFFQGAIDEVRVWNRARTAQEIGAAMYAPVTSGVGLVGRWALDATDEPPAVDSAGKSNGTITKATFIAEGATFGQGLPPTLTDPAPSGDVPLASAELSVTVADPDSTRFVTTFRVREVGADASTGDDGDGGVSTMALPSAFHDVAVLASEAGRVEAPISELGAGHTYEWYATVTDCAHTRFTPRYRFTVR